AVEYHRILIGKYHIAEFNGIAELREGFSGGVVVYSNRRIQHLLHPCKRSRSPLDIKEGSGYILGRIDQHGEGGYIAHQFATLQSLTLQYQSTSHIQDDAKHHHSQYFREWR